MTEIVINKELEDKMIKIIANLHDHNLFADEEETAKGCAEKLPMVTIDTIKAIIGD